MFFSFMKKLEQLYKKERTFFCRAICSSFSRLLPNTRVLLDFLAAMAFLQDIKSVIKISGEKKTNNRLRILNII